jgi:iron complex transport system substrate-binding protein
MPCGFDARRAFEQARAHVEQLTAIPSARVVAVDGSAYFSRPGPRLLTGLDLLAHILHPNRFPQAPASVLGL